MITVVAFGDSITLAIRQVRKKRWIRLLESALSADSGDSYRFINSGVGGNTSREGLARIKKDVLCHDPDYVIVEFGGNDATSTSSRHVPLEEYRANLTLIHDRIMDENSARIILLTFPPIIDEWHSSRDDLFYLEWGGMDACVEQYREITRAFAKEHNLPLVDIDREIRERIGREGAEEYIQPDGVHLTGRGNELIAEMVFPAIRW